jgi:acyl-CoA synthetase (NDP forming)/GNAT superfamily N-acetyltransferase
MSTTPTATGPTTPASVYALLADGTTIEIRPASPGDFGAVKDMHEAMSPDNAYMRFFNLGQQAAEHEAMRICRPPAPDHTALLALRGDEVIGVAGYEVSGQPDTAEIAFAVADHMQRRGVATLLLEHLVSLARSRGIQAFVAETLSQNSKMLRVFTEAGLPVERHTTDGVVELRFPLPASDAGEAGRQLDSYLDAVARRESLADVHSLRHLLLPASVAVVGASRRTGTVGRAILHNIVSGGYQGQVYAVNPHVSTLEGVPCAPSVTALPDPVDLAVVAVPPAAVPGVADECGRRGVKGLVVITSGLDAPQGADLLAICRRYGMRLIGPNCFGVAVPGIGLDATLAARHPVPGIVGLVMQSGGLGLALVDHLSRLGLGISSFASVGNKYDVSSNDMLMWWEHDGVTRLAVMYIESFGNPRRFARTARRVSRTMPVLTVHAGRSEVGQKAAASHTDAAATPMVSRTALFAQAGVIALPSLGELLDAAALLATQPVPAGRNVAVVSNVGGAGVLAADACVESGLTVHTPAPEARRRLHSLIPPGGAVCGPVDTTVAIAQDDFRRCLEVLAADEGVDMVLALVLTTAATGDLTTAVRTAEVRVPLAAVVLDQTESLRLLPHGDERARPAHEAPAAGQGGAIPAYGYPEAAARALARAATYGEWKARPEGRIPELTDLRAGEAHALVAQFLAGLPAGGWLSPAETEQLLACYGIPLVSLEEVADEDAAARAAAAHSGPVVLKADVPGLLQKTDAGAVRLGVHSEADVRLAYRLLAEKSRGRLSRVLLQPMISGGTELIISVVQEPMFGPVVGFGLGGVANEVLGDHAARLAPLTGTGADELIHSLRSAPLLLGHRGAPAADLAALRDTLLRVSRLADDLPEVAELDLDPVIARPDGAFAVDARIRLAPSPPEDPFLRRLR